MGQQAGTQGVRAAVRIEPAELAAWMDEVGLPGTGLVPDVERLGGGTQNDVFVVRRGGHRMVLRANSADTPVGREQRLLAALDGSDVPHARLLATCGSPELVGRPFFVTEFVDGWSPAGIDAWPPRYGAPAARAALATELVRGAALMARFDWKGHGLDDFGRPGGFHERQVDRWLGVLERVQVRDLPGVEVAAEWLRHHLPTTYEPGLMHGDFHFGNVLYRHGEPVTLAAIVDWEMATIGDPLLDLAWALIAWGPEGDDMPLTRTWDLTGMPERSELLDLYSELTGRSTADFDVYVVLARFKLAIVLEQSYSDVVLGTRRSKRLEAFGPIVLELMRKAASLAESLD